MKCTYCDEADHLEIRCPSRAGDRRKEIGLAVVVFLLSFPGYIIGLLAGMWWSAIRSAFMFTKDFWPDAWSAVSEKKKEDGESGTV